MYLRYIDTIWVTIRKKVSKSYNTLFDYIAKVDYVAASYPQRTLDSHYKTSPWHGSNTQNTHQLQQP